MDNRQMNDYDRQSRLAPQDEAIMMSSIAMDKRDVITNSSQVRRLVISIVKKERSLIDEHG